MLDVVFIMLIFFIVTATFIKEAGIDVDKPEAATAVVQEKASILVAIDAEDRVWINRRQVDVRSVRSIIERLHAENPKGTVVIQADIIITSCHHRSCGLEQSGLTDLGTKPGTHA